MTQRIVIRRRVVAARRSGTMESLREGDFERRAMVVAESAVRDGTSSSMMQTMRGGDDADDVLMGDVRDVVDVAGDDTRALNPLVPVSSYVASDGDGG